MAAEKPENLGDPTKIGNIEIFEKSNRKFSNPKSNSLIFRGKFEGKIEVFIRRFEKVRVQPPKANELEKKTEKEKEFEREMELLHEPGKTSYMHENFTRYFCCKGKGDFYYVAIEWCICSVDDLVQRRKGYDWEGKEIDTELIVPSLGKKEILREEEEIDENLKKKLINLGRKEILRQATEGLVFLHAMGFVYRNVKPSNFMIARLSRLDGNGFKYLVKVSDFRMSKNLVKQPGHSGQRGSEGWISPYPKKNTTDNINTHPSEDVFTLGCFYHYVLKGKHPFGDTMVNREKNIKNEDYEVYKDDWEPTVEKQAASLLKDMIKFNPEDRPALKTILGRAYFLPDDYYKLYDLEADEKPGLCVIFNQNKFTNEKDNRDGTDEDKKALTNVFVEFGFDVKQYDNLPAQDLSDKIIALENEDFSKYACLVICILSHGDEGNVFGTDGGNVSIEEAKREFNNSRCPTLSGKPKIWIIQACQGNLLQEDLGKSTSIPKNLSSRDSVSLGFQPILYQPPDISRPPVSEILDIRATVPGFECFRDPNKGSDFIQMLCKQLQTTFLDEGNEKSNRHLEDLLKNVQKFISAQEYVIDGHCYKQTIEWRSTLTNFIRFEKSVLPGKLL